MGDRNDPVLRRRIEELRNEILNLRIRKGPTMQQWQAMRDEYEFTGPAQQLKSRTTLSLKGDGAVRRAEFGPNFNIITMAAGAAANGGIALWDARLQRLLNYFKLQSNWQMAADIDRVSGKLVCCGGLENEIYVYKRDEDSSPLIDKVSITLRGHDACINSSKFITERLLASVSGDKTVKVWEVDIGKCANNLIGHTTDVFCVDVQRKRPHLLVSGAGDSTARVWDTRSQRSGSIAAEREGNVMTFDCQTRDVDDCCWFPTGEAFATALNNSKVCIYDIKACCKLMTLSDKTVNNQCSASQVVFSKSGRLAFIRYSNDQVKIYDLANGLEKVPIGTTDKEELWGARDAATLPTHQQEKTVHMTMEPEGKCFGLGVDRNGTDTIAKIYWP